jgi:putative transcriptional regulator
MMRRMRILLAAMAAGLIAGAAAPAAAQPPAPAVRDGTALVASPELGDPNFARSAVLVLRHDDNGTLGLVINRVTTLAPIEVFPELSPALDAYAGKLFRGGPVGASRVLYLVTGLGAAVTQGPEILEDLFVSGDTEQLSQIASLADGANGLRLFAGHAEWQPGQLEREIATGTWKVVRGTVELVFADPAEIWEQATSVPEGVVAALAPR